MRTAEENKIYMKAYYALNKERLLDRSRQYKKENVELVLERHRNYKERGYKKLPKKGYDFVSCSPEYRKRYNAEYRKAHKAGGVADSCRRRARKANAPGSGVTTADWAAICDQFGHVCAYCSAQESLHMEHVVPLSRGGEHDSSNIVPACAGCNLSKGVKLLSEWGKRK